MRRFSISLVALLAAGLAALVPAVHIAGARASGQEAGGEPAVVNVGERDFRISAPKRASGGETRLVVTNRGPDTHELIVVRAKRGRLPLRADGVTVDEEALEPSIVGTVEGLQPGKTGSVL